ncbi:hypothetical protein HUG12_15660 [Halorarum salinum]|uniref:DUF2213 domain-containing protein n=1 Tax=Halorarum salinum TaxID=2743089 RepID=A0A7D5QJ54_9EURY|nr:hypothetical protein HUG12_15660 [Halobaculum salinum]
MTMKDEHDLRVSARTAQLLASDGDAEDGPPWRFSGVAVAAGDILHMEDGTPVLITEEELRAAAETQTGEPLTVDHPRDEDGQPQYPPSTDETIGKVSKAGWLDDVEGVGYEATTHEEAVAKGVQAGSYEVSVHPTFRLGEKDDATGAYVAKDIDFRDLSVVSKGDSPSNTAQWGPNQALASYTASTDISSELTAAAGDDADVADRQGLVSSTVRGTLEALGLSASAVDETSIGAGNEGAESSADPQTPNMSDNTIETLVANHGFDEESLENMSDEDLERLEEAIDGDGGTDPDGGSGDGDGGQQTSTETDDKTLGEMTVDELGSALQEQGFVTEDNASDLVQNAQAQATKAEKVEEIVAKSDDFDEDDREDLMASADSLVEREHKRVRGELAAQIPANAGQAASLTAGATDDSVVDEYGTGVGE